MTFRFHDLKATQAAAVLLSQENGKAMNTYLFIKMLYIADREAMRRWAEPITGDQGSSMQHGPVLSKIYNLTKGREEEPNWCQCIGTTDPDTNILALNADPGTSELAPSEIEILEDVWNRFHSFTFTQMKRFSHTFPEYDDGVIAANTSKPIQAADIMRGLQMSSERIQQAEDENEGLRLAEKLFGAF